MGGCLTYLSNILGTKTKIATAKAELKELQSTLHTLKAAPTTASLRETITVLEAGIQELEAALVPIHASPIKPISAAEKAAVDAEYGKLEKLLRGRRKQFKDFWGTICDGCGDMNPSDLWVSRVMITPISLLVLLLLPPSFLLMPLMFRTGRLSRPISAFVLLPNSLHSAPLVYIYRRYFILFLRKPSVVSIMLCFM